jgi:MFS transporter, CP family, cyanate transporter
VSAAGFAGLLIAPQAATVVWCLLLGAGLGSGQGVAGVLYAKRGVDHVHTAALSTFAQTIGYVVAAVGPVLAGLLIALGGGGAPVLCAMLAGLVVIALTSAPAAGATRRHGR